MKKIGVAGLQREQIKKTIEATAPGCFEVFIHNDMEAAMKVKSGQLDYYIGACNTGAGAALSIAIAVIGYNKSCTIAKPGIKAKDEHIAKMIAEGKVALLVGSIFAAIKMAGYTGFSIAVAIYFLNESLGRPVQKMAAPVVAVMITGILLNVLYWLGLFVPA
ncbi:TPA: DUF2620 family protein [Escherichia coli]|nr:DUF2620 family protein [Escherichia coli]